MKLDTINCLTGALAMFLLFPNPLAVSGKNSGQKIKLERQRPRAMRFDNGEFRIKVEENGGTPGLDTLVRDGRTRKPPDDDHFVAGREGQQSKPDARRREPTTVVPLLPSGTTRTATLTLLPRGTRTELLTLPITKNKNNLAVAVAAGCLVTCGEHPGGSHRPSQVPHPPRRPVRRLPQHGEVELRPGLERIDHQGQELFNSPVTELFISPIRCHRSCAVDNIVNARDGGWGGGCSCTACLQRLDH